MVAPAVEGIDLFNIAGRSISEWIASLKTGTISPVRQPFCSQLEERLLLWLEYHPQVACCERSDIGQEFAATYRLPTRDPAPFALGYTFVCTFSRVVSIELKRFLDSGIALVECPDCARTRMLSSRHGVLRFPSHDKRKTRPPNTEQRWAMEKTLWEEVGGERK